MFDQPMPRIRGRYYTNRDLQNLFNVTRATIDRWCRTNPEFPKKIKLGIPGTGNNSTRFLVSEVTTYLRKIDGSE